jgi:proline iminopeptidase
MWYTHAIMLRRSIVVVTILLAGCSDSNDSNGDSVPPPSAPAEVEVREQKLSVRDTTLFVRDVGPLDAPVLVVVHGGPGGNHLGLRAFEALAPRFRVVLYDQRGTGESDRFPVSAADQSALAQLTLEENVEDLEALRGLIAVEKINVVGHSWGGALATFYAAAYPEHVERLIVYSGGPEDTELNDAKVAAHEAKLTEDERAQFEEGRAALIDAVQSGAPQDQIDQLFLGVAGVMFPALYCERPASLPAGEGRAGFWANQGALEYVDTFDRSAFASKLAAIQAPALLTWGRCEPSPQERLLYLLDNLPNARFVIFEASGHNAIEEEPETFMSMLSAFVTDQPLPVTSYDSREQVP